MKSQDAYKLVFCNYPDIVNVEQMCEMLGGISQKTAYRLLKNGDQSKVLLSDGATAYPKSLFLSIWKS